MNKKEINGITNPVLRSTVMLSRACTRSNAVDHSFCLLISFLTRFSELSSLESDFVVSLRWKLRDGRLNRNAVSDRDELSGRWSIRITIHPDPKSNVLPNLLLPFRPLRFRDACKKKEKKKKEANKKTEKKNSTTRKKGSGRSSLSFLLVPSIEADKGKRRLAFSSMHSLSLFFLFHSLFSPSHLTLAAALQLSATHAPPSLPPSRTTTQPLVPASS